MGVTRGRPLAAWLAGLVLVALSGMAERLLRLAAAVAAAAAAGLEALRQRAEAFHTAATLSAAVRARAAGRWRAVFEASPLATAKVSVEGRLEAVNAALCTLLGEPERALVGRRLSALVYPDDRPVLGGPGHPGRSGRGAARAEVRLVCAGGRLRWCELDSYLVRGPDGKPEYVLVSVVDITRHKRSQAALRDLATRDPLTGVANRRWFELNLAQHVRACALEGPRGAVLVVDLDNFKQVNDTLGHQAGDRLIMEVALTMRRHLRDQDLVARLGGDEFAVVLHDGGTKAAAAVARKLVLAVREEVSTAGLAPAASSPASVPGGGAGGVARSSRAVSGVTVSVGVAPLESVAASPSGLSAAEALKAADEAMYLVKHSGRDGYALAGSGSGKAALRSSELCHAPAGR